MERVHGVHEVQEVHEDYHDSSCIEVAFVSRICHLSCPPSGSLYHRVHVNHMMSDTLLFGHLSFHLFGRLFFHLFYHPSFLLFFHQVYRPFFPLVFPLCICCCCCCLFALEHFLLSLLVLDSPYRSWCLFLNLTVLSINKEKKSSYLIPLFDPQAEFLDQALLTSTTH